MSSEKNLLAEGMGIKCEENVERRGKHTEWKQQSVCACEMPLRPNIMKTSKRCVCEMTVGEYYEIPCMLKQKANAALAIWRKILLVYLARSAIGHTLEKGSLLQYVCETKQGSKLHVTLGITCTSLHVWDCEWQIDRNINNWSINNKVSCCREILRGVVRN